MFGRWRGCDQAPSRPLRQHGSDCHGASLVLGHATSDRRFGAWTRGCSLHDAPACARTKLPQGNATLQCEMAGRGLLRVASPPSALDPRASLCRFATLPWGLTIASLLPRGKRATLTCASPAAKAARCSSAIAAQQPTTWTACRNHCKTPSFRKENGTAAAATPSGPRYAEPELRAWSRFFWSQGEGGDQGAKQPTCQLDGW